MTKITKLDSTIVAVDNFFKSTKAIVLFMFMTTVFGTVQVLTFQFGLLDLNGVNINTGTSNEIMMAWIVTSISLLSCYVGFIGSIMNIRGSSKFIFWMMIQLVATVMIAFMAGAIFAAISSTYAIVITIIRYYVWKNNIIEEKSVNKKKAIMFILIALALILITFNLIAYFFGSTIYSNSWNADKSWEWTWHVDAIGASFEMMAYTMMIFKTKWAFVLFLSSKVGLSAVYIVSGNILPFVQLLMFATTDISGFLAWMLYDSNRKKSTL